MSSRDTPWPAPDAPAEGTPVPDLPPPPGSPPPGQLVVRRSTSATRDLLRGYRIVVDGRRIGTLRRGNEVTVALAPGRHRVRATIDWSGSPELEVDLAPGRTVRLVVEPAGSPSQADQTFSRKQWLSLRVEDPAAGSDRGR
jgi:hypothetical protein